MLTHGRKGLFLVFLDYHWLKVFGLENLPAIEAFQVIHAVSPGDDLGTVVLASGLHNQRLDESYFIQVQKLVKPPFESFCKAILFSGGEATPGPILDPVCKVG